MRHSRSCVPCNLFLVVEPTEAVESVWSWPRLQFGSFTKSKAGATTLGVFADQSSPQHQPTPSARRVDMMRKSRLSLCGTVIVAANLLLTTSVLFSDAQNAVTCDIPSVEEGQTATLTCDFGKIMLNERNHGDIIVQRKLPCSTHREEILDCTWESDSYTCTVINPRFVFKNDMSRPFTLDMPKVKANDAGQYFCHLRSSRNQASEPCDFQPAAPLSLADAKLQADVAELKVIMGVGLFLCVLIIILLLLNLGRERIKAFILALFKKPKDADGTCPKEKDPLLAPPCKEGSDHKSGNPPAQVVVEVADEVNAPPTAQEAGADRAPGEEKEKKTLSLSSSAPQAEDKDEDKVEDEVKDNAALADPSAGGEGATVTSDDCVVNVNAGGADQRC